MTFSPTFDSQKISELAFLSGWKKISKRTLFASTYAHQGVWMSRDRFSLIWRSSRKLRLNKISFVIFPCLTEANLRKKPFNTFLSHVEPSNLVFWEVDKEFLTNICVIFWFGIFSNNLKHFDFWGHFRIKRCSWHYRISSAHISKTSTNIKKLVDQFLEHSSLY